MANKKDNLKTTDDVNVQPKHNFMVTVFLAIAILLLYKHFVENPKRDAINQVIEKQAEIALKKDEELKKDPSSVFSTVPKLGEKVIINTEELIGSINLQGAVFDDLTLKKYYETANKDNNIKLLKTGTSPYFVDYGWKTNDRNLKLPDSESIWTTDNKEITTETPVNLTWDNGEGLIFHRNISIDDKYMIFVEQSVTNETGDVVSLIPFRKITKEYKLEDKKDAARFKLGARGSLEDLLEEKVFSKITEKETFSSNNGWFGFSDKYWFVGAIFNKHSNIEISPEVINNHNIYHMTIEGDSTSINNMDKSSYDSMLFAGAKELSTIDLYMSQYNITMFDKVINFGWYYFITKPFYYILHSLDLLFGNMGLAIVAFTILLRLAMFPIANKSYASMQAVKRLQPKMKEVKEKYGNDKQKMQLKVMELYQKEKVSPMGGIFPLFIQIPVFFSLYKVLTISIEMRHAPFFGWIKDLSMPDPTNVFTLFGIVNWNPPALLAVGAWPLMMGITMYLQQRFNPKIDDKSQRMAISMMPIVFTFMLARFASGLVIYWTLSNIFAIGQQWIFKKKHHIED